MAKRNPPRNPDERYESSHWGIKSKWIYEVDDPDLPNEAVQMGFLLELRLRSGNTYFDLKFKRGDNHLAFSTDRSERLWLVLSRRAETKARRCLIVPGEPWYKLAEVADKVGGRQARFRYPDIDVQPVGRVSHVVYATEKKGDGPSDYIHAMGENGGIKPMLCVSEDGRLWFAGGSSSVPDAGIMK